MRGASPIVLALIAGGLARLAGALVIAKQADVWVFSVEAFNME